MHLLLIVGSELGSFHNQQQSGGALSLEQDEAAEMVAGLVQDCDFYNNTAARGAAIYSSGAVLNIQASYFWSNVAGETRSPSERLQPLNGGAIFHSCPLGNPV